MIRAIAAVILFCALAATPQSTPRAAPPKPPGGEGWKDLFDGKTTDGWRGFRQQTMPDGWKVIDGALTRVARAGDLVSLEQFDNFELTAEWKIAPGANSGIFYRVVENDGDPEMWMAAPEYQIIDDAGYAGPLKPTQKTAANYDLNPPGRDATRPAGSWNTTRILVNGSHVEHWLNGVLIVAYELWTPEWERLVAESKFKDHPRYARARRGRIGIQDHGDWIAFRSIRIREIPAVQSATGAGAAWVPLFNGRDLAGWKNYGAEKWTVDGGEILGEAVTKEYGYLGTEKTYRNFEMRGKFKAEGSGNSGIFYHASITGTAIQGVQVEVDPRPNMHTGGLYETGGRQWLVWPSPEGERAMKPGEWNDVRFSVNGNHIVTFVNDVLALDYTDPAPKFTDGIIALQLHAGGEGRMRFKDLAIREIQAPPQQAPSPVPATHLQTRWASQVTPDRVLPEYPRPQLARRNWTSLNGIWNYAITASDAARPAAFDGRILVPFAIESQLSGAGRWVSPQQRLWYRRTFTAPSLTARERLLLNFGAVDWEAVVYVNGKSAGEHRGGYDPFTLDITDLLRHDGTAQELVVAVRDPTDEGQQPKGKQVQRPRSIWYTAVTGIWQTVWLEAVPENHITALQIDPDLDGRSLRLVITTSVPGGRVSATVMDGTREIASGAGSAGSAFVIPLPNPHAWSPSDPFLYSLRVRDDADVVDSYFGMRSIAVRRDAAGVSRVLLNGKTIFQFGLLDQGWWPDGLYTAPTDEALSSDIQKTKDLGFNVIRKHVKVEPARWYYHADRLGMLVWQDMPSGGNQGAEGEANYARELRAVIDALRNHPSIVMWVPFNEGWGQHATENHVAWLKSYDSTRLVDNASGWTDAKVGDVVDLHAYPGPAMPPPEPGRASVLGEFGGLGLPIEGHTWLPRGNWGYRSFTSLDDLNAAYRDLAAQLRLHAADGLTSAIYTQTTDVEIEVNGVMTYDRAVIKLSSESIAANRRLYDRLPIVKHLVPASDRAPQTWRYTTAAPPERWFDPAFDDGAWTVGRSGFGAPDTRFAHVGTAWQTPDIWLRRTVDLPSIPLTSPYLRVFHDDDAEVYVNGTLVATLPGANNGFAFIPLTGAARAALRPGANTLALHAHQIRGGQFIDAGLVDVFDPPR